MVTLTLFDLEDAKILADFYCEEILYFRMSRQGRAAVLFRIVPPGMTSPFSQQLATMSTKVSDEFTPFHTAIFISS
jgi:hypothetical protein